MGVEDWLNLIPYETTDGLLDLPTPPPTRVPPGADIEGFAAVSAGGGDEASYTYRPDGMGGWWRVDAEQARAADEAVMRPIVEEAMRAEGMNVPFRPVIPTLPGRVQQPTADIGDVVLNRWEYAFHGRAVAAGKVSEVFRQEWETGKYLRVVIENGRSRITCRSPHMMEGDSHGE